MFLLGFVDSRRRRAFNEEGPEGNGPILKKVHFSSSFSNMLRETLPRVYDRFTPTPEGAGQSPNPAKGERNGQTGLLELL